MIMELNHCPKSECKNGLLSHGSLLKSRTVLRGTIFIYFICIGHCSEQRAAVADVIYVRTTARAHATQYYISDYTLLSVKNWPS